MKATLFVLALLPALSLAALAEAETPSAETAAAEHASIYDCLAAVAREQEDLANCQGLEVRRYLNQIAEAGGNLGLRAVSHAYAIELGGWLSAWTDALEESLWLAHDKERVLAAFTDLKLRAVGECLDAELEAALPMEQIAPCFADVFGPALVEEMQ